MKTRKLPIEIRELKLRIENVPHYASDGLWVVPEQVRNIIQRIKNLEIKYPKPTVIDYTAIMNSFYTMGKFEENNAITNKIKNSEVEHLSEKDLFVFATKNTSSNTKSFYLSDNIYLVYLTEKELEEQESIKIDYLKKYNKNLNYLFI